MKSVRGFKTRNKSDNSAFREIPWTFPLLPRIDLFNKEFLGEKKRMSFRCADNRLLIDWSLEFHF